MLEIYKILEKEVKTKKSLSHTVLECKYHVVWGLRRKIIKGKSHYFWLMRTLTIKFCQILYCINNYYILCRVLNNMVRYFSNDKFPAFCAFYADLSHPTPAPPCLFTVKQYMPIALISPAHPCFHNRRIPISIWQHNFLESRHAA